MLSDVVYPLLIVAGCAAFMAVVHILTRPRPTRLDIGPPDLAPPETSEDDASTDDGSDHPGGDDEQGEEAVPAPDISPLEDWHSAHETDLLTFIEAVDDLVDTATDVDEVDSAVVERLSLAARSHPSAEMRGELAGMASAATALEEARARDDSGAGERQTFIYLTYRRPWLERLEQFGWDRRRIRAASARRLRPDEDTPEEEPDGDDTTPEDAGS